jgi:ubiquinone biosynthesis protein
MWRNLGRTREIVSVLLNHGFGDVLERLQLGGFLRWWRRKVLRRDEPKHGFSRAERIRLALEELGPTFVKFGQVASTRPDLVPASVITELRKLQERVPPFAGREAIQIIEHDLGAPISRLFLEFDPTPLAAGSLGQVHRARHLDGTPLAVKVRRPNVVHDVERDLSLMARLAELVERHIPEAEIFDPIGLVTQFARSIRREMNFGREGRTLDEFRRLFRQDATLYVPRVFWELTGEAVLTMEFLDGLSVHDPEVLRAAGVPPDQFAGNGARIFIKMAFEYGLFHGDPHPGNIRVLQGGVIGLIDYGMVGRLEEEKREQLVELLLSVTKGDVRRCTEQVLLLGKPSRPVDRALLQTDVRDFIETYYGVPLERINVAALLSDFVGILSNHGIRYPADLMLLIRAIVTLEGVGRNLDPNFNLAIYLAPSIEQIVRDRYNPQRMARRIIDDIGDVAGVLRDLPGQVGQTLEKLSNNELEIHIQHHHLEKLIVEVDRSSNRVVVGLVMSALILASALVLRTTESNAWWWVAVPAFTLSSLLGVWLIYGVFRSGRL